MIQAARDEVDLEQVRRDLAVVQSILRTIPYTLGKLRKVAEREEQRLKETIAKLEGKAE